MRAQNRLLEKLSNLFSRKKSPLADGTITGDALAAIETAFRYSNESKPEGIQYTMLVNYTGDLEVKGYFLMTEQGRTTHKVPFKAWAFRQAMYVSITDDPRGDHLVFPRFGDKGTIDLLLRHTRPHGLIPDIAA